MMKTIVLTGLDGCGKSTLAHGLNLMLVPNKVYPVSMVSPMAEQLRRELTASGKYPAVDFWLKPTPIETRNILIGHGMMRRMEDPDYWVKKWAELYITAQRFALPIRIIDDVRFINEVNFFRKLSTPPYGEYLRPKPQFYHIHIWQHLTPAQEEDTESYHINQNSHFSSIADTVLTSHKDHTNPEKPTEIITRLAPRIRAKLRLD